MNDDKQPVDEAAIRATMTPEQIQLERKLTCEAIDGAIAFGYQNTNPPPSEDHWLAPYWKIGRKLSEAEEKASVYPAHTESAAPIYAYEWDCGPGVVHRDFRYGTYNDRYPDRTLKLYAASPAAVADETIAAILRLRKNPDKGDEVFRCGYNGAIDAVAALLAATPAPATADALDTTKIAQEGSYVALDLGVCMTCRRLRKYVDLRWGICKEHGDGLSRIDKS